MKNRYIKAYDVNLISMERGFIFCFKTTYVSISSCFGSIVWFIFFMFLHPVEKELPVNPLYPLEISGFNPPSPLEFPVTFRGGGMDIFWNHTINIHKVVCTMKIPGCSRVLARHMADRFAVFGDFHCKFIHQIVKLLFSVKFFPTAGFQTS